MPVMVMMMVVVMVMMAVFSLCFVMVCHFSIINF